MNADALAPLQIAIWLGLAYITVRIAHGRGRSVALWGFFGLVAPVISLICALCLSKEPPQEEPSVTILSLTPKDGKAQSKRSA